MLRSTGRQVDAMVLALLDAANDKNEDVRQSILSSLQSIGTKEPQLVLSSCSAYLQKHNKLPLVHRIQILITMQKVCQEALDSISADLASDLIKQVSEEMVSSKDLVPDWQGAASGILVALGVRFCHEVMEILLAKLQPGVLPHFFIMQTLANLSSANVYGIVPFLKAVLGTMLPMLGTIRQDNMKWVISYALAKFSEAILEYLANIDKAPDPTVRKEVFATEASVAYDVLLNSWLQSKESKLRLVVVEALGHLTHLLSPEKLEEQLPRLISSVLSLYKKQTEPYLLTQGLCMVLDAAIKSHCIGLELQLDHLLHVLFPQVCTIPDFNKPLAVKNQNEVLRCFFVLTQAYPDPVVQLLLNSLENNNEKVRIGSLTVLRHLINTAGKYITSKIRIILNGLMLVLQETNNKVKKVFAHLVVALAHHNYLEEGGSSFLIEFIVSQCSLTDDIPSKRPVDPDHISNEALRSMCENILHFLTTTVQGMENILWPHLLDYIIPEKFTNAVGVVCKSASSLAIKLREDNCTECEIDLERQTSISDPTELTARLIVLLGYPLNGGNRGISILKLMKILASTIEKNLVALWDAEIPFLISTLTETVDGDNTFDQNKWENSALQFLSSSLNEVDKDEWTKRLGQSLANQVTLYSTSSYDKAFLYKCLGVVLKKTSDRSFIIQHLEILFSSVIHSVPIEREGCSVAFGLTAAAHFDTVLAKLDQLIKMDSNRKSSLLSFLMDSRSEPDFELAKATLILCYGSAAVNAPSSLLVSRVETSILQRISSYFQQTKVDSEIKVSLLQSVNMIAQAVHPSRLREPFLLDSRKQLLQNIQNYLQMENSTPYSYIRPQAINCFASLIKLEPKLLGPEREPIIKSCLDSVYPLVVTEDTFPSQLSTIEAALDSLNNFIKVMILEEPSPDNLYSLFVCLEPWLQSINSYERRRSMASISYMMEYFLENIVIGIGKPSTFGPLGAVLARIVPRCTDPDTETRQTALTCLCTVFKIATTYQDCSKDNGSAIGVLENLQNKIVTEDATQLFLLTKDLGQFIAAKLPVHQVAPFLHVLFEGLVDSQPSSSSGVCVVFNTVIKSRGDELHQQVEVVLKLLHHRLGLITNQATRKGALQILRTLASHHLTVVITFLLNSPLPFDNSVLDSWKVLAQDPSLGADIVEHLLDLIATVPPCTDHPDPRDRKATVQLANNQTLSAVYAMREMFRLAEMEECSLQLFCRLYATLLLLCGVFVGSYAPSPTSETQKKSNWPPIIMHDKKVDKNAPIRITIEAFQAFLLCSKQEELLNELISEGCWLNMENTDKYPEAIACLARALTRHAPQYLVSTVSTLNSSVQSPHDPYRVVGVAFFAELINQRCHGDGALLELLLNNLVSRLVDNSQIVRKLCIRGLGYVGQVGADQVHKYSTTVLSAMVAGLDDKDDPRGDITLEAMSGLSKVLAEIEPRLVSPVLINIALRIRSCFENVRQDVRAAAFTLFGDLSRFANGDSQPPFIEQIHNNLVTLLLHLNDEDRTVIKACKYALRLVGPLLSSSEMNTMFQKHLLDEAALHYGEFMNDLTKVIVLDFPDNIHLYVTTNMLYFKSSWSIIQSNAAMFVGFLLGCLPEEKQTEISRETVCTALILLLKDPSKDVRIKAADAMSLLHSY